MTTTLLDYLIKELLNWTKESVKIGDIKNEIKNNEELLVTSLKEANDNASGGKLKKELYDALQWPLTLDEYVDYLYEFGRWIPKQSTDPAWERADEDGSQEPYDRLCHFHWLIDQDVEVKGKKVHVQNDEWFAKWLVRFADAWGSFLDTTESFNRESLQSFINLSPRYNVKDSMIGTAPHWRPNEPSGWLTFNQFFARELNPGLRPINSPGDNQVVTSPADCTWKATYDIDENSEVVVPDNRKIRLKKTHSTRNIKDLLKDSKYAEDFANGKFVHYFLSPYSYHRFHLPVTGEVLECRAVPGLAYLEVHIGGDKQFDAPDSAKGGYQFQQSRGVVVVDTSKAGGSSTNIGKVAIIPVGMCQIGSVNLTINPKITPGKVYNKGDEFGYFLFGGSDIILLFQNEKVNKVLEKPEKGLEPKDPKYFYYGMKCVEAKNKN